MRRWLSTDVDFYPESTRGFRSELTTLNRLLENSGFAGYRGTGFTAASAETEVGEAQTGQGDGTSVQLHRPQVAHPVVASAAQLQDRRQRCATVPAPFTRKCCHLGVRPGDPRCDLKWSPKSGHPVELIANGDEEEQRGWQTKVLRRRVQGVRGA